MGVLVYSERKDLALELATLANELSDKLGGFTAVALLGPGSRSAAEDLREYFDKVYPIEEGLSYFDVVAYVEVLSELANEVKPHTILMSSTRRGSAIAAGLAAKIGAVCVTEVSKVELEPELLVYRSAYGGLAQAKISLASTPRVLAVKPASYPKSTKRRHGAIEELRLTPPRPSAELIEVRSKEVGARLEEADVVVVVGRGVKRREDLPMFEELAKSLGGALGCTRPLSADLNWFPIWVGMSGVTVKPKLYVGVGVSGQIQHIAGIRESKVIVAVNIDPNAPIFEHVDYGIIGDLYKVVPALLEELKKRR